MLSDNIIGCWWVTRCRGGGGRGRQRRFPRSTRRGALKLSGKTQGLVVGSRRRFDQVAGNSRDSLPAAVTSLKSLVGLAAVPGDEEHEAIRIIDTVEHVDVLAAAIASEDLRERMGFLDEGCPMCALNLEPADFVNAHRLSLPFTGLGRSCRGGSAPVSSAGSAARLSGSTDRSRRRLLRRGRVRPRPRRSLAARRRGPPVRQV